MRCLVSRRTLPWHPAADICTQCVAHATPSAPLTHLCTQGCGAPAINGGKGDCEKNCCKDASGAPVYTEYYNPGTIGTFAKCGGRDVPGNCWGPGTCSGDFW